MNRKIPVTFPLFESIYGNSFPEEQYFIILFDALPSTHSSQDIYSDEIIKCFIDEWGFIEHSHIKTVRERGKVQNQQLLLVNETDRIIISTRSKQNKGDNLISFDFLYDIGRGDISKQLDFKRIEQYKRESKKSNIQIVKSEMGHLDTEEYDLTVPEFDLLLNYGEDFVKLHKTIVERLNTPGDKGLILFHGEHGTGKTTYIKSLTNLIKNKEVLFIPPSMAETLSDPSIIPFLMEHKDSILLIEDAEKVIGSREVSGSQVAVSNILNLTDGILGDCLNIQIIATFNMPRAKIDKALLRKGRLICEHKFDKLSLADTNILLKHLNKGVTSDVGLTLADIYNIGVDANRETSEPKRAGFQYGKWSEG